MPDRDFAMGDRGAVAAGNGFDVVESAKKVGSNFEPLGPGELRQNEGLEPWLNVVLYQPEIPPNTGNIGRTCVALGAKLWLVRPLGFRVDARTLRRAGMDYWQHLQWQVVDDWDQLLERLGTRRLWLVSKFGQRNYDEVAFQTGDALVFGSESVGLPAALRAQHGDACLRIPMCEVARSLNLASAVAVVAYEARRQLL